MNMMLPSSEMNTKIDPAAPAGTRIFVSAHAPPGEAKNAIGKPHYSYAFATEGHMSALAKLKVPLQYLAHSDQVSAASWRQYFSGEGDRNVHLIFRNFRSLRPVKWARNIAVVVWEFDEISGAEAATRNPFRDQVRMLKACDEIWVASTHTHDVFRDAGVENVHVIPAPVSLAEFPTAHAKLEATRRMLRSQSVTMGSGLGRKAADERPVALGFQSAMQSANRGPVYLAMCNPLDPRKQLSALVQGFTRFWVTNPDAVLIIKMSADPKRFPTEKLTSTLLPDRVLKTERYLRCPNIIFVNSFIDNDDLAALHHMADFFISPTRGEGQNLPLQEAMLAGTPVIAPNHTAMADYLRDGEFIPIQYRPSYVPLGSTPHYHAEGRIKWYESGPMDVHAALVQAAALSPEQRIAMGRAGQQIIKTQYSADEVALSVARRLSASESVAKGL